MIRTAEQPDVSLVLPAYNEESRISSGLRRLSAFAREAGYKLQVIVVDDGSSDSTAEFVEHWMKDSDARTCEVELVRTIHRGKGAAVRAGMRHVSAPLVGYCDVDLSAGTDALSMLLKHATAGWDVVIASRGLPESVLEVRQPWYREAAGRAFNLFLRKLARIPYKDTQCGLKLFTRAASDEIFRHQRLDGLAFDAEVMVLADRLGFRVKECPVRWSHDEDSKVAYLKDGLSMCKDVVRIVRRLAPDKIHALGIPTSSAMKRMVTVEDRHWWYAAKRKLVMTVLTNERPGPCLDLGCGGGAMLSQLSRSREAFGVDLASSALDHARSRGLNRLVRSQATSLPFADNCFQAALVLDVLEHDPCPVELLGEVKRVLKPEGLLLITVPAFKWMWSYADHILGHYRRYTISELEEELSAAGFHFVRLTYFHSWLLPVAWTFRRLRSLLGRPESADDFELPRLLNRFFLKVSMTELRFLQRRNVPFGLSVLGLARPKPQRASSLPASRDSRYGQSGESDEWLSPA